MHPNLARRSTCRARAAEARTVRHGIGMRDYHKGLRSLRCTKVYWIGMGHLEHAQDFSGDDGTKLDGC